MTRGNCPPQKVFLVRNGPDPELFKLVAAESELKKDRRYMLAYVGEIAVQDSVDIAIQALHNLVYKRGRQDTSLVLMGTGEHLSELKHLSHKLQLDEYINFRGWTKPEHVVRYLSIADVGISPDSQNGLNEYCTMLKTMEYMAMEKPIVAFDLPETRFSAQDAALYATPNHVEDFANKIEALLENEDLRKQMGQRGRKRVEEELAWNYSVEYLLVAYRTLFG